MTEEDYQEWAGLHPTVTRPPSAEPDYRALAIELAAACRLISDDFRLSRTNEAFLTLISRHIGQVEAALDKTDGWLP